MQNSIPCDVVLLPSEALSSVALEASTQLAKLDNLFQLDNVNFYAHVSLYMLELKQADIEKVKDLLAAIAKSVQAQQLTANKYDQKELFIDAEYTRTATLDDLQSNVINALNSVRNGMRGKDVERMKTATGLALENYQNYGYKYVGELFRPHITLTRFGSEQQAAEEMLPDITTFNGTFDRIGLFAMGDNGTCIREIESWELQ